MLTLQEIHHIAKLARLELTDEEIEKYRKDLSVILDYVAELQELDVSLVQPMSHSVERENVMRHDRVQEEDPETINALFDAAPQKERGYIRTKGIL